MSQCTAEKPNRQSSRLERVTFRTSRLMEFCSEKELTNQTGHERDDWRSWCSRSWPTTRSTPARKPACRLKSALRSIHLGLQSATTGLACRQRPSRACSITRSEHLPAKPTSPRIAAPRATHSRPSSPCRSSFLAAIPAGWISAPTASDTRSSSGSIRSTRSLLSIAA